MTADVRLATKLALSPVSAFLIGLAATNAAWLAQFSYHIMSANSAYAFPDGLHRLIAARLTIGALDLSYPAVIAYNLSLVVAPIALLRISSLRSWSLLVLEEIQHWLDDHPNTMRMVALTAIGAGVVLVGLASYMRLPFLSERVRWATDWFPLPIPLIPPFFVRLGHLLTRIIEPEYVFGAANLAIDVLVLAFIVRFWGGRRVLLPVAAAYASVALTYRNFYFLSYAEAPLAGAALGLMGLVETQRGRLVPATFYFMAGMVLRPDAMFYAASAGVIFVWQILRRERRLSDVPWSFVAAALVIIGLFGAGLVLHELFVLGPTFAVSAIIPPFILGPLRVFLVEFVTVYPIQTVLTILGLIWAPRQRLLLLYIAVSIPLLRSVASLAGGYYTLYFLPIWALAAGGLFVRLWDALEGTSLGPRIPARSAVLGLALCAVVANLALDLAVTGTRYVTRATSGWDARVGTLASELPADTRVVFRKLSPRYDLERRGRRDLTFIELPEDDTGQLTQLRSGGPILYVAPDTDLQLDAPALASLGYEQIMAPLATEAGGEIVFLLKRK